MIKLKCFDERKYKDILMRLDGESNDKDAIEELISNYFKMIRHMKETSLYDVYMYESNITKGITTTIQILSDQNSELKSEVNKLRKKLELKEKYKE